MLKTSALLLALLIGGAQVPAPEPISSIGKTDPVTTDADDPAIWVHPTDPTKSLIFGTDKAASPDGGLWVFDLNGKARQTIRDIERPNNVDVAYGLLVRGVRTDIAVTTERFQKRLRVFAIDRSTGMLSDISGATSVFEGAEGEQGAPMGVALYRRRDGVQYAIVSRKEGPREGYLHQYRLRADRDGRVNAEFVRAFGQFSGEGEIEAIGVDQEMGYVYYADEQAGVRKYHADPDARDANRELAFFAREGYQGDREGIAFVATGRGQGWILVTDQRPENSLVYVYRREGEPGQAHEHRPVMAFSTGADDTDGIETLAKPLGSAYPHGLLLMMNSKDRNFLMYAIPEPLRRTSPSLSR